MALQTSGTISMDDIRDEMGETGEVNLRDLASTAGFSTPDLMSDFYGYSHVASTPFGVSTRGFTKNHACGLNPTFTTYYHDGDEDYPLIGDNVYTNAAMTTTPTNGWYQHEDSFAINLFAGLVLDNQEC